MYGLDFYFAVASPSLKNGFLIEVEAVRQKLDFLILASPSGCLGFNIRNDPRPVRRAVLVKDERRHRPSSRAPLWYAAHSQMRPRVKRLPVTFSARFRADLEDFVPVKILAEFAKTGCPVKNVLLTITTGSYF